MMPPGPAHMILQSKYATDSKAVGMSASVRPSFSPLAGRGDGAIAELGNVTVLSGGSDLWPQEAFSSSGGPKPKGCVLPLGY